MHDVVVHDDHGALVWPRRGRRTRRKARLQLAGERDRAAASGRCARPNLAVDALAGLPGGHLLCFSQVPALACTGNYGHGLCW